LLLVMLFGWMSGLQGPQKIKFSIAQQIYQYKNTKSNLYRTNAAVWCNKTRRLKQFCQVSALNWVQNRAAKFVNNYNINESVWEYLTQRILIARICALFKTYTGGRDWKAIGDRFLKPCYLSREDHDRKISTRKEITHVGKYSFVNRTINPLRTGEADLRF
jgi:hypothetical protein